MSYPTEILPQAQFKLIECDLSSHYVIRHTDSNVIDDLWDDELDCIKHKFIALQSLHAIDMSTSLLGVFKGAYTKIQLTESGNSKYNSYCHPNEEIPVPTDEDFLFNNERGYWTIAINDIDGKIVNYEIGVDPFKARCYVVHTPTKWNYWHFSIRWLTDEGFIHDNPAILKKKWVRRLGHNTIVLISQFARLSEPIEKSIEENCYRETI